MKKIANDKKTLVGESLGTETVTIDGAARLEGVTARAIEFRIAGKHCGPSTLIWKTEPGPSGRLRKMIYVKSLSLGAQKRWSDERLEKFTSALASGTCPNEALTKAERITPPSPSQLLTPAAGAEQLPLIPPSAADLALSEAISRLPQHQHHPVRSWLAAIQPLMNHDFAALHLGTKTEYTNAVAAQLQVSARHVMRKRREFEQALAAAGPEAAVAALVRNDPGPPKFHGSLLDPRTPDGRSMMAFIQICWEDRQYSRRQTCAALKNYLETKQRGSGASHIYEIPSPAAVSRYINLPPPDGLGGDFNPRRNGAKAVELAAGYIDCHYDDEYAGQTWCTDEWELHGAFYDEGKAWRIINYGKHTPVAHLHWYIDERTTCVLGAVITLSLNTDTVLDLAEQMVRAYGVPKYLVSDRLGIYRRLVDRVKRPEKSSTLYDAVMGPLGILGVEPRGPKSKHNPRGNRIEAMNGIFAEWAPEFGPSYKPPLKNHDLRPIDEAVARHLRDHCELGTSGPQLMSIQQAARVVAGWIHKVNTEKNDVESCRGLTRLAAWRQFQRPADEQARRRPSLVAIDQAFAERVTRVLQPGGIVELREGLRYSSVPIANRAGETVQVLRLRRDLSRVWLSFAGEEITYEAELRDRVGRQDQEAHAEAERRLALARRFWENAQTAGPTIEVTGFPAEGLCLVLRDEGNDAEATPAKAQPREISGSDWIYRRAQRRQLTAFELGQE